MSAIFGNVLKFGTTSLASAGALLGSGATATAYSAPLMGVVIALGLIALIVYIVVLYGSVRPTTSIQGPVDLFKPQSPVIVNRDTTERLMKSSYSLAFYVRMDAVPDMRTDAIPLMTWPSAWRLGYNPAHEELVLTASPTNVSRVPGVTLQKWIQITMTFEGRTMDFYINGKLVQTYSLDFVPGGGDSSSITLVPGGIMGQIAFVQVWPRRLRIADVAANYTDTCDSQGRPYLGAEFVIALQSISIPTLFCPSGDCSGGPKATPSQQWEFPYA